MVLAAIVIMASCSETAEGKTKIVTLKAVENLSEYVIVRGENSSAEVTTLASTLRKAINDATGASISVKTDYNFSNEYEILIGETRRNQSIKAHEGLRCYDYTVRQDGNKIVIAAGSEAALGNAIELFKEQFISTDEKLVRVPAGDGYSYNAKYKYNAVSVDGVDLGEFKLLNRSLLNVDDLTDKFRNYFGADVILHETAIKGDEHYVIIDGTGFIEDEYSITVEEENLIIRGSAHSLPKAIDVFFGSYIKSFRSGKINITAKNDLKASTGKPDIYTKDQLMTVIDQLYADPDKIVIGEQCPGSTDANVIADCINGFAASTGEMPGIIGIDLACYGIDLMKTDDLKWSSYICDIVDFCAEGGMITASAHWANPSGNTAGGDRCRGELGYEDSDSAYKQAFIDLITEGTEYNKSFKAELAENARFLKALGDNGVTVIWRPLHEANGSWFWFCTTQGTNRTLNAKYLINVWQYVYDYFTKEQGLSNLIWSYAPNYSSNVYDNPGSTMSTTYLYPGDEYCDMVGVDWYSGGKLEIAEKDNYLRLTDLASKPGAITEFGPTGVALGSTKEEQATLYNAMDLYGDLYELTKDGYSFVYLLTWAGKCNLEALSRGYELMQTDLCIGQTELKAMLDKLK